MDIRAKKPEPIAHSEDQEDELLSIVAIKGYVHLDTLSRIAKARVKLSAAVFTSALHLHLHEARTIYSFLASLYQYRTNLLIFVENRKS